MSVWLFAPEGPRRMALVRIVLALALLCEAVPRWRYSVELYSTDGPAIPIFPGPRSSQQSSDSLAGSSAQSQGFHLPIPGPLTAVALHTLLLFALVGVFLGWQTRLSLLLATITFLWIGLLDLPGTFAKHSVIALHSLFLLLFSGSGQAFSIDDRIQGNRTCRFSAAWPRRLLQILICTIYFGAALTKIRTPAFLSGDLLTFSLLDAQWGGGSFGLWLSTFPVAMRFCSLATIFFELFFPVLVWLPAWRRWVLASAFLVHAAMGWALHLGTFSLIMFAVLLAFLEERDLTVLGIPDCSTRIPLSDSARDAERSWPRGRLSIVLFAAMAFATVGVGTLIQWRADWYGSFGNADRTQIAALQPIDSRQWSEMQAERRPAWEDYVHRVSFGTRTTNWEVYGASNQFRIGERAYVLVQFILPHPALTLEGLLLAPDSEEVARFKHEVAAGYTHSINGFELTNDLPEGAYRIILQIAGEEVLQRRIEIVRSASAR